MSLVTEHLDRQGCAFEVIPHPQAHTSIDEARAVGVDADEVLETLALRTAGGCKAFPGTAPGHRLLGFRTMVVARGPYQRLVEACLLWALAALTASRARGAAMTPTGRWCHPPSGAAGGRVPAGSAPAWLPSRRVRYQEPGAWPPLGPSIELDRGQDRRPLAAYRPKRTRMSRVMMPVATKVTTVPTMAAIWASRRCWKGHC